MSKAAQPSESAPESFEQYQSLKSAAVLDAPSSTEKVETESETAQEPPQEQKPPSDEEKADRKQRNDQRRERRWYEERGAIRAENRELRERLERLEAAKEQSPTPKENAKPTLKTFLESGKFKTYEEAQEAYTDALTDFKFAQRESEREGKAAESSQRAAQTTFQQDVKQFSKTHDDFDETFELVRDRLDGEALELSNAIVRGKNPAALIHYLGTHEDEMDELLDLKGDERLMQLGVIRASLTGKKELGLAERQAPAKEEIKTGKPKAPKTVAGRGNVVTRDERMKAAADANDFTAFRAAARARDKDE